MIKYDIINIQETRTCILLDTMSIAQLHYSGIREPLRNMSVARELHIAEWEINNSVSYVSKKTENSNKIKHNTYIEDKKMYMTKYSKI